MNKVYERYIFQVGDEVRHQHERIEVLGIITELLTEYCGGPVKKQDVENPWYHIDWNDPDGQFIGFEHQCMLVPSYLNPTPGIFMDHVCRTNKTMWDQVLSEIKK